MRGDGTGRARPGFRAAAVMGAVACAVVLAACSSGTPTAKKSTPSSSTTASPGTASTATTTAVKGGVTGKPGYFVYWDQNEEVDLLSMPAGGPGQLMPAWDLNGQVCVLPDGRFVGGVDPTLPGQRNLGSAKPYKQPADGEELDNPDGSFSGRTLYVPGPFKMPGQTVGQDSPATPQGDFNGNSTYTGCAVGKHANVFGADIATAQGAYPVPDSGRLVEWFAPSYTTYCIVYGPTAGGVGPHHADGTGGLAQPGMMAVADNGDLLVPNVGTVSVLRFADSSLPKSAADCPGGVYPRRNVHITTFFKGDGARLPFPAGVAKDPTCGCYALSSYLGDPSIIWVDKAGKPMAGRGSVPGTLVVNLGKAPGQYNPFGMAFAPDGTMYFVDIHIACKGLLSGCGPASYGGRLMKGTVRNGQPDTPVEVAGGFDFPTSATICVPAAQVCPYPSGALVKPLSGPSENPAPAKGP